MDFSALRNGAGAGGRSGAWHSAAMDGAPLLVSANAEGQTIVAVKGGQVLSWIPRGGPDVLWVSDRTTLAGAGAIRGGIPVCWPWFGLHRTDPNQPQHGLVRTVTWDQDESDEDGALRLRAPEPVLGGLAVALEVRGGATLSLSLITTNLGTQSTTITEALHTYFRVGGLKTLRIGGLDGCDYADNADPRAVGQPFGPIKKQTGPVSVDAGGLTRIYDHSGACTLIDAGLGRLIRIEKEGSASTIVWNPGAVNAPTFADLSPGAHEQFICIESGTGGPRSIVLAAGETHTLSVTYSVEAL